MSWFIKLKINACGLGQFSSSAPVVLLFLRLPPCPYLSGWVGLFPSVSGFIPSLGLKEQVNSGSYIVAEYHGGNRRNLGVLETNLPGVRRLRATLT